jgi:hypothetical protein
MEWQRKVAEQRISRISRPGTVLDFTVSPGLLDTCLRFPVYAVSFAPYVVIRGSGGPLEDAIEAADQRVDIDSEAKQRLS